MIKNLSQRLEERIREVGRPKYERMQKTLATGKKENIKTQSPFGEMKITDIIESADGDIYSISLSSENGGLIAADIPFMPQKKLSQMFWLVLGIVLPLRITQMRKTDVKYSSANDY